MPSTHQLTKRQIRCIEKLPEGHKMVNTRDGAPIVRRPDRQLFQVQPNGRLAATIRVERVQAYLDVHG
jgi:transposase